MRIYIHTNKTNFKEYTVRLLQVLLAKHLTNSPLDADVVAVPLVDVTEFGEIAKARVYGKPVLAGGLVSEYPVLNELADYVWHGEAYDLADALDRGCADLAELDCITTPTKRRLVISHRIEWSRNPIVKVGARAMYYYVSKGCPVRCKYCLIGNARDYQIIPERLYHRALGQCGRNLMPIAAYNPYGVPGGANVGETLMRKYNAGESGERARMIRTGMEFVSPQLSRDLAKGVTIDDFNEALRRAGREGTKLIIYFIAGLESQSVTEEFFQQIQIDYNSSPAVNVVFTYIDPQPMTPLHDLDLREKIVGIDAKRIYAIATERNKRVRVLPLAGPERSTVRTLMGRARSLDEYAWVSSVRRLPYDEMLARVEGEMGHLLGESNLARCCARPRRGIIPDYWEVDQ